MEINQILEREEEIKGLLEQLDKSDEYNSILIFSTFSSPLYQKFDQFKLGNVNSVVWGGFFPKVFCGESESESGTVCIPFKQRFTVSAINDISQKKEQIDSEVEKLNLDANNTRSVFMLIDAFATTISDVIEATFNNYGLNYNYFGGGCGSLDFIPKPSIFIGGDIMQDSVVFATTTLETSLGVKHGWEKIAGPFQVTKSEGNTILEIDFKPAFDVYQEVVNQHSSQPIGKDNFFDIAKGYPFGIPKMGTEVIVRDPITTGDSGELNCVGNVPQNSFVHIMTGNIASLKEGAKQARDLATGKNSDQSRIVFMDCISRSLFFEQKYSEELAVISGGQDNVFGAAALGEIANTGDDYLEFYNKTCVICRT
ncbi:MAG: histidine kinase [Bdellovibrionales bacterium]|jgi:hypothetical protein|nr:histidine kinase [Bdellovibrionales bacterium]MBT3525206.1 histidine kinase [Bdellovibrionales bacterium]MBT7667934.1 histidine kinase [Bdellovibrionales bacterium]MBT7768189.1 histidine kinase [Bdellovibrionales bacterium]